MTEDGFNIVVVSYATLRREVKVLSKAQWHYCILDEGHLLKNPKTGKKMCRVLESLSWEVYERSISCVPAVQLRRLQLEGSELNASLFLQGRQFRIACMKFGRLSIS